jgi:hypothetical protein
MLSAKFFGSSPSNTVSSYNKNFVQTGLSNGGNSPWIYQNSGGNIIITTTTPYPIALTSPISTGDLIVNGTSTLNGNCSVLGNLIVNGSISILSDLQKKKNIKIIPEYKINLIEELVPVEYEYKESVDKIKHYGFIAQSVGNIYPNLIIKNNDVNTINYIEIIPLLVGKINNMSSELSDIKKNILFKDLLLFGIFCFSLSHCHKLIRF